MVFNLISGGGLERFRKKINFFFGSIGFNSKVVGLVATLLIFLVFFDVCVVSQVVRCSASLVLTQSNFLLKKVLMMFNCR